MNRVVVLWLSALAMSLAGCRRDESLEAIGSGSPPPPATETVSEEAAEEAPLPSVAPAAEAIEPATELSAEQVPIAEDFADEAEQRITEQNVESELERLEAEIGTATSE